MDEPVQGQVKTGFYVNSVTERWAWFLPTASAGIGVQFLGIWLTLALPRLWTAGCVLYRRGTASATPANARGIELEPRDHDQREQVLDAGSFALDRIWNAGLPQNRLTGGVLPRRETNMVLHDLGLAFISIVFFILVIVLGSLINLLTGDSVGLAQASDCGYYLPGNFDETPAVIAAQTRLQVDAASYAQSCYGGRGNAITGCNLFAQQAIPYTSTEEVDCPFSGEMCLLGSKGAIKFSTGPVPAQALGFNTGKHLEFKRSTSFAPLVRNETFVQKYIPGGDTSLTGYQFFYGWTAPPDIAPVMWPWTYQWYGINRMPVDNTYEVGVVQENRYYMPIPELQSASGKRLTILFVSNKRFRYAKKVDDPLFEARFETEAPVPNPQDDQVWWTAGPADDSPRVLACVDEFKWRDRRSSENWTDASSPAERFPSVQSDRWRLLPLSLDVSTIWDVVSFRLAAALNASSQTPPNSFFGVMTPDQWKIEARQLFEASLARAQFETRNMALGLYAGLPNYVKSNMSPEICREAYLVNAPGYTNIFAAPWVAIFVICSLIVVATFPTGTREDEKLLFERLPDSMVQPLANLCVVIVHATTNALDWILRSTVSCSIVCWKFMTASTLAFLAKINVTARMIWSSARRVIGV
ncbi:hypothetical protein BP6252_14147 [Coleophoma cylindrospora]|uniref:Uncharacterized protein n=1 Tax=Coleophoma cylindrospora TaxID=1849047 RepID=A0A3D8Q4Y6_9HELO|nr:hypothetical protein BP6252_14147 [Coleophoma cylindrospora]